MAKDTYLRVPVDLEGKGVILLFEKGVTPQEVPLPLLKRLFRISWLHFRRDKHVKEWEKKREKSKEKLVELIKLVNHLRGIESPIDKFRVLAYLAITWVYDRELMKKSLGAAYSSYVAEDLQLNILLPAEEPKIRKSVIQAVKSALAEIDKKRKQEIGKTYEELVSEEIKLRVREEDLEKAIRNGKVKLLKGARMPDLKWTVKPFPLE